MQTDGEWYVESTRQLHNVALTLEIKQQNPSLYMYIRMTTFDAIQQEALFMSGFQGFLTYHPNPSGFDFHYHVYGHVIGRGSIVF